MKKILPVSNPIIKTYPSYANQLSILQLDYKRTWLWIVSNLLTITSIYKAGSKNNYFEITLGSDQMNTGNLLWNDCPYLNYFLVPRKHFRNCKVDIIDFIKSSIDDGYYIYTFVRQCDISLYQAKASSNCTHDIFIYGYDDDEGVFHCADYFDIHYSHQKVSYNEIKCGFENVDIKTMRDEFEGVVLMSRPQTKESLRRLRIYETNISSANYLTQNIICRLKENIGLLYNDRYMLNTQQHSYGIDIYNMVTSYLAHNKKALDRNAMVFFYFIQDHKQVLLELAIQFNCNETIIELVKKLHNSAIILNNLILKLSIHYCDDTIELINKTMHQMESDEKAAVAMIITFLENKLA